MSFSTVVQTAPTRRQPVSAADGEPSAPVLSRSIPFHYSTRGFSVVFSAGGGRQHRPVVRADLRGLPREPAEESADVTGSANQGVLQAHFGLAPGSALAAARSRGPVQLCVPSMPLRRCMLKLECLGLHFPSPRLQQAMQFADEDGAMALARTDALLHFGQGPQSARFHSMR